MDSPIIVELNFEQRMFKSMRSLSEECVLWYFTGALGLLVLLFGEPTSSRDWFNAGFSPARIFAEKYVLLTLVFFAAFFLDAAFVKTGGHRLIRWVAEIYAHTAMKLLATILGIATVGLVAERVEHFNKAATMIERLPATLLSVFSLGLLFWMLFAVALMVFVVALLRTDFRWKLSLMDTLRQRI